MLSKMLIRVTTNIFYENKMRIYERLIPAGIKRLIRKFPFLETCVTINFNFDRQQSCLFWFISRDLH
jgi:hypothetical protein